MNYKIVISAVAGVVVGSVGSYFITKSYYKKKYEKEAEEHIRKTIENRASKKEEGIVSEDTPDWAKELLEKEAQDLGYTSEPEEKKAEEPEKEDIKPMPKNRNVEFISANELDEEGNEYETIRYTWYTDGVLARDDVSHDIMTDPNEIIDEVGIDFREVINKSGNTEIYIRDHSMEYDYIIEKSSGPYANI